MSQVPAFGLVGPLLPMVEDYVKKNGKLPKTAVLFSPGDINPVPPIGWVYKCSECRFYIPGPASERWKGHCTLVSDEGIPDPGFINGQSWCILNANRADDPPFGWIQRRLSGEPDPWQQ